MWALQYIGLVGKEGQLPEPEPKPSPVQPQAKRQTSKCDDYKPLSLEYTQGIEKNISNDLFPALDAFQAMKPDKRTALCFLNNFKNTKVKEKKGSASPSLVMFGNWNYNKNHTIQLALKLSLYNQTLLEKNKGKLILPMEYERNIYQSIINPMISQKISPNFVAYVGTMVCNKRNFYTNNGLGRDPCVGQADKDPSKAGLSKADFKELKQQLCTLDEQYREPPDTNPFEVDDAYTYPADCIIGLLTEGIKKPIDMYDWLDLPASKEQVRAGMFQLIYTLHCMEEAKLMHYDMHFGNVLVETDTSNYNLVNKEGFIVYVLSENDMFMVPVKDNMVKCFDWDFGYNPSVGNNSKLNWTPKLRDKRQIINNKRLVVGGGGSRGNKVFLGFDLAHALTAGSDFDEQSSTKYFYNFVFELIGEWSPAVFGEKIHTWGQGPKDPAKWGFKRSIFTPSKMLKHQIFSQYRIQNGQKVLKDLVFFAPGIKKGKRNQILQKISSKPKRKSSSRRRTQPKELPPIKKMNQMNKTELQKLGQSIGMKLTSSTKKQTLKRDMIRMIRAHYNDVYKKE